MFNNKKVPLAHGMLALSVQLCKMSPATQNGLAKSIGRAVKESDEELG